MKSILIVDDDAELRDSLAVMLSKDFKVKTAGGKDEAMAILNQPERLDLMLLDVKMETRLEGFEFVVELAKMKHTIPIIIVSSTETMLVSRAVADIARKTREKYAIQDLSVLVMKAVNGEVLVDYQSEKSGESISIKVDGFHPKPVKIEKLKEEINTILSSKE